MGFIKFATLVVLVVFATSVISREIHDKKQSQEAYLSYIMKAEELLEDHALNDGNGTITSTPGSTTTTEGTTAAPGLSGGAIAGIVIGSLAAVALIGGGVFYLYKKRMYCFENM